MSIETIFVTRRQSQSFLAICSFFTFNSSFFIFINIILQRSSTFARVQMHKVSDRIFVWANHNFFKEFFFAAPRCFAQKFHERHVVGEASISSRTFKIETFSDDAKSPVVVNCKIGWNVWSKIKQIFLQLWFFDASNMLRFELVQVACVRCSGSNWKHKYSY